MTDPNHGCYTRGQFEMWDLMCKLLVRGLIVLCGVWLACELLLKGLF